METYINVGTFVEFTKDLNLSQQKIDVIADYYHADRFNPQNILEDDERNSDMIIRVNGNFGHLSYASKDYFESDKWGRQVDIIPYDEWLYTAQSQSQWRPELKKQNHYIYLLKDNLSFALMTMSGDVADDYITLLDYSDISEVNVYTADFLLNSVSSGFNMDKFYQIPVNNPDNPTINDVFDFLKKEK